MLVETLVQCNAAAVAKPTSGCAGWSLAAFPALLVGFPPAIDQVRLRGCDSSHLGDARQASSGNLWEVQKNMGYTLYKTARSERCVKNQPHTTNCIMSFEVFLQCFQDGRPAGIPLPPLRALFPIVDEQSEKDYWFVRYDDESSCDIYLQFLDSDLALVHSLTVHRPCANGGLWKALLEILRLGPVTLYFPGDAPPLVATEHAGRQIPNEMIDVLGRPNVVSSPEEIIETIRHG
jgi:hypothetical protein